MGNEDSWKAFYPEAARNFDDSSIGFGHLAEVLGVAAQDFGTRPAVSTQLPTGACTTLNYNEIDRLTGDFATYLREVAGVEAGDVVALMSPNCIDFLLAVFGIFKAGCICTNVNPLYTAPELEHQLNDSGAKVLVFIDLFGDKVDAIVANTSVQRLIRISLLDFFPPLKKALMGFVLKKVKKLVPDTRTNHVTMAEALKQGAAKRTAESIDVSAYRAGQTSDDTALFALSMYVDEVEALDGDCALVVLPLYHVTAFVLNMLQCLVGGAHCVMIPNPRPASNLKAAFEKHAVTHLGGINTLFAALLEEPWCTRDVFKHLRYCGSGGAAQHVAVAERWETLTGVPIHQGYGLTECAGVLTINPAGANRLGSAGVPVPGTVVKIVDSQGIELQRGEAGEVIARGPIIMKGYLKRPEATGETVKDGWLLTGDIGVMDEDGYVQIVDRKKDMILVSGFNVYPNEIEDVIARLDQVVEVGVIGVPDENTGESVKAYVVSSSPQMTTEHVIAHCEGYLTNYKRPKHVEFVDEIPKTPVGKVLRRNLREKNAT
jgi:long-chain acyl-CoA synthetase